MLVSLPAQDEPEEQKRRHREKGAQDIHAHLAEFSFPRNCRAEALVPAGDMHEFRRVQFRFHLRSRVIAFEWIALHRV